MITRTEFVEGTPSEVQAAIQEMEKSWAVRQVEVVHLWTEERYRTTVWMVRLLVVYETGG